ncbi:isochorismatase domain-containing protein 2 [Acipenser ruthenus]|uniref:isochorismatase domain-containing protein 2 n=1 Tax=Acipenser ruthenus TaxID=7906 RepID=UPI00145A7DB8|nr:isochorismatase domain-containing protein 2 [Acipenser ruthenus]XP_034769370.1 isochorismatase domain-containing protein 2 [Acipenser ruthenus]
MSRGRLSPQGTILLLCDLQEKFRPHIVHFGDIVSNAARLLQASRILGVPAIVSEQYPRGLGPTVPELGAQGVPTFSKTSFSMLTPEIEAALGGGGAGGGARSVLLCGIEAQACITCTALDLLDKGLEVHLIADAVSSRSQTERLLSLSRLRQSGVFLNTVEGVILQLVQDAAHPKFKQLQKLLTHPSPDTGLLSLF